MFYNNHPGTGSGNNLSKSGPGRCVESQSFI